METWVTLIVLAAGMVPVAIAGLWGYMSATAAHLHPNPGDVPSVMPLAPSPEWADRAEQGRQVVRAGLSAQNLPGLSVAVGIDGGGDEGPLLSERCERPVEGLRVFAEQPLLFQPGTRYRYSSYGWILVSAAVEAAAGEPFLGFMRTRVFEPMGMRDTNADSATEAIPNRATPYFPRFAADPRYGPDPMRPIDYSCYAGASVFLSTPSDLVRFGMAINGGKLLQPTVQLLQTSQRLASGEETGYGLGWDLETVTLAGEQARSVGHEGTLLGGMAASLITFPERRIAVSVISNISYADTEGLALKIAQAFAERPSSERR